MIIMKVKFQKTGSDIIPNKAFWMSLPLLVKVKVKSTYNSIYVVMYVRMYKPCTYVST